MDVAAGKRTELLGLIQSRYGHSRETAEKELDAWARSLDSTKPGA